MRARTLLGAAFLVVLATVAASFYQNLQSYGAVLRAYAAEAASVDRADTAVRRFRTNSLDLETGVRGWLISRDRRFLEPYERAMGARGAIADEMTAALAIDPASAPTVARVEGELEDWIDEVARPQTSAVIFDEAEARRAALNFDGKTRMDAIRADIDALRTVIDGRRARQAQALVDYESTLATRKLVTGALVGVVLLLTWLFLLRRIERPLGRLVEVTHAPVETRVELEAAGVDEIARVGRGLVEMRERLAGDLHKQHVFTELVAALAAASTTEDVAAVVLGRWTTSPWTVAAVLWVARDKASPLEAIATHAVDASALPAGGGPLAREVRRTKKTVVMDNLGDGALVVKSSLLEADVSTVTVTPILAGDRVVGVMELAGRAPDPLELARGAERIGLALEGVIAREQNDRLGAELRAINEELEAQNEELRQQEEELRAQGLELERREAELSRRNSELVDASSAKSTFLSSMSHEIRTPLNAVIGFAEVLLADTYGPLSEPQRKAVGDIQGGGRQLLSLVNDVLDLAKVEAGRLDIRLAATDATSVVGESCMLLMAVARRRRVSVEQTSAGPASCVADPDRLRQIVINLVGNAIKFTPEGGVVRVVTTRSAIAVRIDVIDTGPGIAPEDAARLFQPFSQLEGPAQNLGTGLGLAIAKRLVDLMGGTIELTSEVGHGSTFSVTLPAAAGTTLAPAPRRARTPAQGMIAARGAGSRILVVEDESSDARVLEGLLGRAGHRVRVEATAESALGALTEEKFDAVIVDLRLPGMSGIAFVDALRADPALRRTRTIVLTGTVLDHEERAALEAKVDLVAEKGVMTDAGFLDAVMSLSSTPPGARVLVVDDNEANRRVARAMLESAGHLVDEASSGEEAIERVGARVPDVVLMDIRMPGLDGLETTARLHADAPSAKIPVVAVSAQAMRGDRERALAAGCVDYVTKPVARGELLRAVDRALSGQKAGPESKRAESRA